MTKGPIQRDSLSRCENPSMLYDTIRYPNAQYVPPKTVVNFTDKTTDTIESTQQRLNREMLDKFQSKGLELPHESFVAVVQVGKYLFLAIMLPPYLCLYAFPQWLLFQMIPQLAVQAKELSFTVGKFVVELSKRVTDLMKGMMEQLIGDALKLAAQGAKRFVDGLQNLYNTVAGGVNKLLALPTAIVERLSEKAASLARSVIKVASQWAVRSAEVLISSTTRQLNVASQFVQEAVFVPVATLFSPLVVWSASVKQGLQDRAAHAIGAVQRWIQAIVDPMTSGIERATTWTAHVGKKCVDAVVAPIIEWAAQARDAIEKIVTRAVQPMFQAASSIQAKVIERFNATVEAFKHVFSANPVLRAMSWVSRKVRGREQRQRQALGSWGRASKQLSAGVWNGVNEILGGLKRGMSWSLGWFTQLLSKVTQLTLRCIRWFVLQLIQLPQKTMRFFKRSWVFVRKMLHNALIGLRIVIVLISASFRYALFLIHYTFNKVQK